MAKKISLLILTFTFSSLINLYADTLQLKTVVPPPIGASFELQLKPQESKPSPCPAGTVYFNTHEDNIRVCDNTDEDKSISSHWEQNGNNIYLRDILTNSALRVGIGTDDSSEVKKLTLAERNTHGINNIIKIAPVQMEFYVNGDPVLDGGDGNPRNWANAIDFFIKGQHGNRGRVIYEYRASWGPSGLGLVPTQGLPDIWIDEYTNISVGQIYRLTDLDGGRNTKLQVNGNLKTNKIYLKSDGINTGELKAEFSPVDKKYYVSFAP